MRWRLSGLKKGFYAGKKVSEKRLCSRMPRRGHVRAYPEHRQRMGLERKPPDSNYELSIQKRERIRRPDKTRFRVLFQQKENPKNLRKILKSLVQTMGPSQPVRRQRTLAQRQNSRRIHPHPSKNIQTIILPKILPGTKPSRTMLETSTKKNRKQTDTHPTHNAIPPTKNIQKHKQTTKNVQIFIRLAINSGSIW